jgi:hypothetical protein
MVCRACMAVPFGSSMHTHLLRYCHPDIGFDTDTRVPGFVPR